jgi:drug/metabolite transporter (DMT)-like permease
VIAAGVAFAVAAAVAAAFAVVLQSVEARQAPPDRSGRLSLLFGLARRPRWLLGTALLMLAWPLQVLALTFAPITVVQPALASFQLVLLILARTRLRESVGRIDAFAGLAIVAGVALIVSGAPRRSVQEHHPLRLALTLVVVAAAALAVYAIWRRRPERSIPLVIGAGLAYAWVDFADKLLSNAFDSGRAGAIFGWLAVVMAFGALAFLQENSALQRRPATGVAPVIAAIQEPLPVLMALAAGVEAWRPRPAVLAELIAGLVLVAAGAVTLGRSHAVQQLTAST